MFLHLIISKLKKLNKFFSGLLYFWIVVLTLLYSVLSIVRHDRFQSGGFDLGLYDQAVWKYSKFLTPYNTVKERIILGDHFNITLPLISPLFYIVNNVKILLIFQAFFVVFSTLAVYKIIIFKKFSPLVAFILSIVYSLFYGIQYLIYFDFHPIAIGVGLLPWLIFSLETKKRKLFIVLLALCLLTQENMGIAVACIGLIYVFRKEFRKTAIILIFLGFIYSILSSRIIATFSPVGFQYQPQISLNPIKSIAGFFDSQEKRLVWLYSLSWLSFLPVFSLGAMIAVILDLAQYFVTGNEFSRMWSPFMHHRAILVVFLFLGLLDTLCFLRKKKINIEIVCIFILFSSLFQQYYFHYPLNKLTKKDYWKYEDWMKDNENIIKLVPKNAGVATQQSLVPHLSHRSEIYLIWPRKHQIKENNPCGSSYCWWLDFGGKPEYLVVDLHPNQWITQLLESNENFASAIDNMEKMERIRLEKKINNAKIYKINYPKL